MCPQSEFSGLLRMPRKLGSVPTLHPHCSPNPWRPRRTPPKLVPTDAPRNGINWHVASRQSSQIHCIPQSCRFARRKRTRGIRVTQTALPIGRVRVASGPIRPFFEKSRPKQEADGGRAPYRRLPILPKGGRTPNLMAHSIRFERDINPLFAQSRNCAGESQLPAKGSQRPSPQRRWKSSLQQGGRKFPATAMNCHQDTGRTA